MTTQNDYRKRSVLRALLALPVAAAALAVLARPARAAVHSSGSSTTKDAMAKLIAQAEITDARQQITEVVHRYARGNDRADEEAIRSCFFSDSTHQHGAFEGKSQDFVTFAMKIITKLKSCTHMITNVSIEISGARAVCECYFLAHHRRNKQTGDGEEDYFIKGRYLDRFEKRDGVWKIAHRRGLSDFARIFDPADTSLDALPPEQLSVHSTDDPIYAMLANLRLGR